MSSLPPRVADDLGHIHEAIQRIRGSTQGVELHVQLQALIARAG